MIASRRYKKVMLTSIVFSVFVVSSAFLARDYCNASVWGRNWYRGYFTNRLESSAASAHGQVILDGLTASSIRSKAGFINFILSKLNGGGRDGIGAAFIIQTMRGQNGNPGLNPPSSAEINDWKARINAVNVTMDVNVVRSSYNSAYGKNIHDDIFYNQAGNVESLNFRVGGAIKYQLKVGCANAVGGLGLPAPPPVVNYAISGTSLVASSANPASEASTLKVHRGDTVIFRHRLKNSGTTTATGVHFIVYDGGGAHLVDGRRDIARGATVLVATLNFVVPATAVDGTKYCQLVGYSPTSPGGGSGGSVKACAVVEVAPPVGGGGGGGSVAGCAPIEHVDPFYWVNEPIPVWVAPVPGVPGHWISISNMVQRRYPQALVAPSLDLSPRDPAVVMVGSGNINAHFSVTNSSATTGRICEYHRAWKDRNNNTSFDAGDQIITSGQSRISVPSGTMTATPDMSWPADMASTGGRLCVGFRIELASDITDITNGSEIIQCVSLSKRPTMSVQQGDVWSGGSLTSTGSVCSGAPALRGVYGSTFTIGGTLYGSLGQLAVGSTDAISSFGSNGYVYDGGTDTKSLMFANTPGVGNFRASNHCLNDPYKIFTPAVTETHTGNYTMNGETITGRRIIHVTGDLSITDDISFSDGPYDNPSEVPQLVILVDGSIRIDSGVVRLDGLYAARGKFVTCATSSALTMRIDSPCGADKLQVNGAIVAGGAVLATRSHGASPDSGGYGESGEDFNLSGSYYMGEYSRSYNSGSIETIQQTELPPRF
jgi:hypothetical protein